MDLYDLSFFLSTMWVGPFWLAMLVYPEHERTKQILRGPWFFIGPIAIWWVVIASDPEGLIELSEGFTCLLYTSPSPRDGLLSRMPSSA